ncbi:MAG: hypothetical protein GY822_06945 [Deltaproteobacteria bacterium]|nr:hypothetical protein [Deltaproteobacteria bacterium]
MAHAPSLARGSLLVHLVVKFFSKSSELLLFPVDKALFGDRDFWNRKGNKMSKGPLTTLSLFIEASYQNDEHAKPVA